MVKKTNLKIVRSLEDLASLNAPELVQETETVTVEAPASDSSFIEFVELTTDEAIDDDSTDGEYEQREAARQRLAADFPAREDYATEEEYRAAMDAEDDEEVGEYFGDEGDIDQADDFVDDGERDPNEIENYEDEAQSILGNVEVEVEQPDLDEADVDAMLANEELTDITDPVDAQKLIERIFGKDAPEEMAHVDEVPETGTALTIVEAHEDDGEDEDEPAARTRNEIIAELTEMYSILKIPYIKDSWAAMPDNKLEDLLYLVKADNGGSINVATVLAEVESDYQSFINSDYLSARMKLVDAKAVDQIAALQKLHKAFGKDFIVNSVRVEDYHTMLKSAVSYISVMTDMINQVASKLGMVMPEDELLPMAGGTPIVEGTPADPRIAMYTLKMYIAHLNRIEENAKMLRSAALRHEQENVRMIATVKALKEQLDSANAQTNHIRAEYDRFTESHSHWLLKDRKGRILRLVDENGPFTAKNMDLRGDFSDGLYLTTKRAAQTICERVSATHRFRNYPLAVYRVSIVAEEAE